MAAFDKRIAAIQLSPAALAAALSIAFSVFVYPRVAAEISNERVGDRYDRLASGLLNHGTLAYYPDTEPTTVRTPLYPLLLALCMGAAGEAYEFPALMLQAMLHASTVLLLTRLLLGFAGPRPAFAAGLLCAVHPVLLWYSVRFVIETLLTLLFTLALFAAVRYWMRPSAARAVAAGACLGLGLWCKAVFAPLIVLFTAMVLMRGISAGRRHAAAVLLTSVLLISPWLVRNGLLTGEWPLLQTVIGLNLRVSDSMIDHFSRADPLSLLELNRGVDYTELNRRLDAGKAYIPLARREALRDSELIKSRLSRYAGDPLFLAKKVGLNAMWFWALGSDRTVTLFMAFLQGCLLSLCIAFGFRLTAKRRLSPLVLIAASFAAAYYVPHMFVFALGRFSVPLIPSLIASVFAGYFASNAGGPVEIDGPDSA